MICGMCRKAEGLMMHSRSKNRYEEESEWKLESVRETG